MVSKKIVSRRAPIKFPFSEQIEEITKVRDGSYLKWTLNLIRF
jgi:hypothetical protein